MLFSMQLHDSLAVKIYNHIEFCHGGRGFYLYILSPPRSSVLTPVPRVFGALEAYHLDD